MSRYKVWIREPDGQPGTLLLRTGSDEQSDCDIGAFVGSPSEVAIRACSRHQLRGGGFVRSVLVKDFDTDLRYTVHLSSESAVVVEGWH